MIQDIYPSRFDNSFKNIKPKAGDAVMCFKDEQLLASLGENDELAFPAWSGFSGKDEVIYAFSIDGKPYFMLFGPEKIPDGFTFYHMKEIRKIKPGSNVNIFAAYSAYHLWKWYTTSRFCGACGGRTVFDEKERAMCCPKCGNRIYPRINPAVIIGVTNKDSLLITRYRIGFKYNALVAGFTEFGETFEETVKREVMEETGLKVKNIRYYKSQPWGIALDILAGYFCDVDGDDTIHMDRSELKYAEWVKKEDIELQPNNLSLTNEMMRVFRGF